MDESADARRILTAVPQNDWKRPAGRPHTSWLATMKNDLSYHNLSVEDATELALDRPLWRLLAESHFPDINIDIVKYSIIPNHTAKFVAKLQASDAV